MKILFCIQASAQHAARWINEFVDQGWDIDIFENISPGWGVCPAFKCGRFHVPYPVHLPEGMRGKSTLSRSFPVRVQLKLGRRPTPSALARAHEDYLFHLLRERPPDVIHLLGLGVNWTDQSATLMRVRERLGGRLPCPLLYSTWGTDLDFFAAMDEWHLPAKRLLAAVDGMITECDRDLRLAEDFGFRGRYMGKLPAFGGTDMNVVKPFQMDGDPSARRLIVVKGRDHQAPLPMRDPVGRAMTILKAIERCSGDLCGYRVVIVQADKLVEHEAKMLATLTGVDVHVMHRLPYEDLLRIMGAARAAVAMTVNDGLPSFLVEAMSLGALPVHSDLEPIREWIDDGVNGLLAPPEDVGAVAEALVRAVSDDALVNKAAQHNERQIRESLDAESVREQAVQIYEKIVHARPHDN